MYINNYFNTTIWSEDKPEFVKSLNKVLNILMMLVKEIRITLKNMVILE